MKNLNKLFAEKELVNVFEYSTASKERYAYTDVNIDGRWYTKYGTLQAVTMVGGLYKTENNKNLLVVGISKQHPNDNKVDKKLGYEVAHINMLNNPAIVMEVDKTFKRRDFNHICSNYINSMDLAFIKTNKEKQMS